MAAPTVETDSAAAAAAEESSATCSVTEKIRPGLVAVIVYRESKDDGGELGIVLRQEGCSGTSDIIVSSIQSDSIASSWPIRPGDVIDSINGQSCDRLCEARNLLATLEGGITITVRTSDGSPELKQVTVCLKSFGELKENSNLGISCIRTDDKELLQLSKVYGCFGDSPLAVGDFIWQLSGTDVSELEEHDFDFYLQIKTETLEYLDILVIKASKSNIPLTRWQKTRRASVAVAGGTLVTAGAVVMATPLHPIGHALAIGGVSVLATEFEAPKRALSSANAAVKRRFGRNSHHHCADEEEEEDNDEGTLTGGEKPTCSNETQRSWWRRNSAPDHCPTDKADPDSVTSAESEATQRAPMSAKEALKRSWRRRRWTYNQKNTEAFDNTAPISESARF